MQVGLIGLPLAGKTTIYNALTRSNAATAAYSSGVSEIHTAVIDVADPRVSILSDMFRPRKTTRAKMQFVDISGISRGQAEGSGLDAQTLHALSTCDALLLVVRAFENEQVIHPEDSIDPVRDLETLSFELLFSDLAIVERRIERIENGMKKARSTEKPMLVYEMALMERLRDALEAGTPIRDLGLEEKDQQLLRGFQFLSAKPTMVVVNIGEDDDPDMDLAWANGHEMTRAIALRGAIEMEIAQLPEDEAALFLEGYGIKEPSLDVMVRECYDLLGQMSFFTVGEDEVRAWTVNRGANAVEAASAIHSDLARGFIRAETLAYEDMIACGTIAQARKEGKLRLEGKEYVLADGDILNIRFNV